MERIAEISGNHADKIFAKLKSLFSASDSGYEFTRSAFLDLTKPSVYVIRDEAGHVLYVGQSAEGFRRITSEAHLKRSAFLPRLHTVQVYPCASKRAAVEAEALLIHLLSPELNTINRKSRMVRVLAALGLAA
jgi:excinuclease UvrABC nuclease subunit